jgi:hypothetical protein
MHVCMHVRMCVCMHACVCACVYARAVQVMDPSQEEATKLAQLLRSAAGVNKVALGDFLGENNKVSARTLQALVRLFDLRRLTVDQALRIFLEAFRLPGEAQQIDRVLQVHILTRLFLQYFHSVLFC